MDYAASQNLVNDLLGDGTNFDLNHSTDDGPSDSLYDRTALNDPSLWSESESQASDNESPANFDLGLANLKMDVRGAVRFKSRKGQIASKKGRKAAETLPTFEVQGLLGTANQLFVNGKLDEAQEILEEVIRIDYNVFAAWQTLGEVHKDRGNIDKCLTAWMSAAHLRPKDADMWRAVANLSLQCNLVDQADYCYNKLSRARPQDVDILWDRAMLNREYQRNHKAIEIFRQLLKLIPFEITTVRELARSYLEEERIDDAISLYESTSDYYMAGDEKNVFNWSELNIMAELYITAAAEVTRSEIWRNLITRIKGIARWLCGRQYETWWDDRPDDAEWDLDNSRRRLDPRFVTASRPEAYQLPLDIRIKLGKARLNLRDKPEALRHFDFLDGTKPEEVSDLFLEAADALLHAEMWDDALECYSKLTDIEELNGPQLWSNMAKAFKYTEEYEQAEECLDAVLSNDPTDTAAMVLLAEVYELTDRRQEALETINKVIDLRRLTIPGDKETSISGAHPIADVDESAFFQIDHGANLKHAARTSNRRRKGKKTVTRRTEDLIAYEKRKTDETSSKFKALRLCRPEMLQGDPQATESWLSAASDLIDDFRNIRHFYPSERKNIFQGLIRRSKNSSETPNASAAVDLEGIANRLEESITADQAVHKTVAQLQEFRGYSFSDWLEIFLQYAVLLVDNGESEDAFSVLEAAYSANVFYQHHEEFICIHMARMMLAIKAKDTKTGAEEARWIMINCLFRNDGLRLYGAALSSGVLATDMFRDNGNQKFMLRLVKTMDHTLGKAPITGTVSMKDLDDKPESIRPVVSQPVLLMLYGHIVATGRGYIGSLQYYIRAYAHAPEDVLINFSIGLSYLHRSMQRQSDNRHLQVMQAFSFLFKYYDKRLSALDAGLRQEADYNMGRALHQLGLLHLAIPYYRKAMTSVNVDEKYDLSRNAAFNLQLIYVLSGNTRMAQKITEQHLTF